MALRTPRSAAPGPATEPSRVHAVRQLAEPPVAEDQPREWYAVELTWTPDAPDLSWAPQQLAAVTPGQPADEATWGEVTTARRWEAGAWAPAEAAIAGPQRVRLLLAVWPDGPTLLDLRRGDAVVAPLDLGRARSAPAIARPETFDAPGECATCQDMTLLNAGGVCQRCRQAEARAANPAAAPAPAGATPARGARGPAAPAGNPLAALRGKAGPALLGALVVAFMGVQGGLWLLNREEAATDAPPEVAYASRLGLARDGLNAYQHAKQGLPADAAALTAFMATLGAAPIKLVAPADPLPREAVVYQKTPTGYELYATTAAGERAILPEGKAATTQD